VDHRKLELDMVMENLSQKEKRVEELLGTYRKFLAYPWHMQQRFPSGELVQKLVPFENDSVKHNHPLLYAPSTASPRTPLFRSL
jgi:hypothetical protein